MKLQFSPSDMARLGWDQSFLEEFITPEGLTHSTDFQSLGGDVTYGNLCNICWTGGSERNLYQNLLYVNSIATADNENSQSSESDVERLKFLLDQVERKKNSHLIDNPYSSSSQTLSPHQTPPQSTSPTPSLSRSSLPPSPTIHPKNQKVRRKEIDFRDIVRNSPIESILNRNNIVPKRGEPSTPRKFYVFRLVERYGLAKLLKDNLPNDPLFQTDGSPIPFEGATRRPDAPRVLSPYNPEELQVLRTNLLHLLESGFYLGKLTADESRQLLNGCSLGTFFVRDSSNPGHLLSLSVQTRRGATSIRIFFRRGLFGLETDAGAEFAPVFDSVLRLVQHYVENPNKNVLVESSGRCDTPVVLTRPLVLSVPRLGHLARLTTNSSLRGQIVDRLCLIPSLKEFLKQYPFCV